MTLDVGDEAPDITLKDQNRQAVTLSSFRGQKAVLIVFYPFAFSGVCTGELNEINADLDTFQNDVVQVLPVSVDHPFTLKAWADARGYAFPLLSDFWPHGAVAQQYGVFNDKAGFALRGTFLVRTDGTLAFTEVNQPGEARDQGGWRKALSAL